MTNAEQIIRTMKRNIPESKRENTRVSITTVCESIPAQAVNDLIAQLKANPYDGELSTFFINLGTYIEQYHAKKNPTIPLEVQNLIADMLSENYSVNGTGMSYKEIYKNLLPYMVENNIFFTSQSLVALLTTKAKNNECLGTSDYVPVSANIRCGKPYVYAVVERD